LDLTAAFRLASSWIEPALAVELAAAVAVANLFDLRVG
jgi:hypothetical protein